MKILKELVGKLDNGHDFVAGKPMDTRLTTEGDILMAISGDALVFISRHDVEKHKFFDKYLFNYLDQIFVMGKFEERTLTLIKGPVFADKPKTFNVLVAETVVF